jgi:hypothetical protein
MKHLTCSEVAEWLIQDLDQGLRPDRIQDLERHMNTCHACRQVKTDLSDLWSALERDIPDDPGEAYWKQYQVSLDAKLEEAETRRARPWGLAWKGFAVLAPAAIALALVILGPTPHAPYQRPVRDVRSATLFQELSQHYGPTAEEVIPGAYVSRIRNGFSASDSSRASGVEAQWFEVEDDPSFSLL